MLGTYFRVVFYLMIYFSFTFAQNMDDDPSQYLAMDIEELLNVKVQVSSTVEKSILTTPSTVTIINRKEIDRYNFLTLPELLQSLAGIEVYQTIIDRNVTTSRGVLQNFYANKILLMINNIPTWQPIYGDGHLERININDIERIEVLRGPASVLYGSNAYSGVVNLVLRNKDNSIVNGYGKFGYKNITGSGINLNYFKDEFSLFLSANSESEVRDPYEFTSTRGRTYNGDSVFVYTEEEIISNFNVQLEYDAHTIYGNYFNFSHTYLGAHPSYVSGAGQLVNNQGYLLHYSFNKPLFNDLEFFGNISYESFERDFPLSADKSNLVYLSGSRTLADIKLHYQISKAFELDFGSSFEDRHSHGHETRNGITDQLITVNMTDEIDVREWSFFSQMNYKYSFGEALLGGRYTNNELFGDNLSFRITSLFKLNERNSLKLIFGQAFRAPTLFEVYFNHPTVVGNPDLKPETSTSYELAYNGASDNLFVQTLLYYEKHEDIIQRFTEETGPPSIYRNMNNVKAYGLEFEMKYSFSEFADGYLNYNFIGTPDEREESYYKYVPEHTWAVGIIKQVGSLNFTLHGKYYSDVNGHLENIPAQFKLDLNISYKHKYEGLMFQHIVSIKNITDSDMLIPEYIRQTPNINTLKTTGFGRRIFYTLKFNY